MYRYSDTLEFDLAVLLFVVVVMPCAVLLMQSKSKLARAASFALMFLAFFYVGGFEHYRLHRPEVTEAGLKRALVPNVVLEMIESEFELKYLPIAGSDARIAEAVEDVAAARAVAARGGANDAEETAAGVVDADDPLIVHLSHKGAGDRFFRTALHALEVNTCGGAGANGTDASGAGASTNDDRCVPWCSGSEENFRQDVHSFTFESPMPRSMRLLGRDYRAVFVVRDPRDLVAQAYLEHLETSAAWARLPRDDLHGDSFQSRLRAMSAEDGVDLEIDRFTASISLALNFQRMFLGHGRALEGSHDNAVGEFARSMRAFATAADDGVRFVRFEDLLAARPEGFELLGRWFGLSDGAELDAFVNACGRAQVEALGLGLDDAAVDGEKEKARRVPEDGEIYCDGGGCAESSHLLPPGAWKEHFSERNAQRFEKEHATLLRSMGYLASSDGGSTIAAV